MMKVQDTEHIGFMFLMGSRIIIAPFKVVIAVMILFRLFWKVFVYSSIVCDVDWYIRVTKEIHYELQRVDRCY